MPNRYTVKVGNYFLAPNPAIVRIEEPDEFFTFVDPFNSNNASCATDDCGQDDDLELTLRLTINGGGSLYSAEVIKNKIEAELTRACNEQILFYRRVRDENALEKKITRARLRPIDPKLQFLCPPLLKLELAMSLKAITDILQPVVMNTFVVRPTIIRIPVVHMTATVIEPVISRIPV